MIGKISSLSTKLDEAKEWLRFHPNQSSRILHLASIAIPPSESGSDVNLEPAPVPIHSDPLEGAAPSQPPLGMLRGGAQRALQALR